MAPKPRPAAWRDALHGTAIGVSIVGIALFLMAVLTPPPQLPARQALPIDELKYRVLAAAGDIAFCDRDFYPVARLNGEQVSAIDRFPAIRKNAPKFSAILKHLGLAATTNFTPRQELAVYREFKKLAALPFMAASDGYAFEYHTAGGLKTTQLMAGMVSLTGNVTVTQREPSFLNCPI